MGRPTVMIVLYASHCLIAHAGVVPEPALCCGWQSSSNALEPEKHVQFLVQVREQNLAELSRRAYQVSDPDSEMYGQFISQDEISELTAPLPRDVQAVREWITSQQGITVVSTKMGRIFDIKGSVEAVSALLGTSFRMLSNPTTGQVALRASNYTVPNSIDKSIAAIFGLHGLPLPPKPKTPLATVGTPAVTPEVIMSQYNVGGVKVSRSNKNRQAVAEFQGQTMNHTDLKLFFKKYVPDAQPGDEKVTKFVGDPGDKRAQVEASLDIQYIMGVAPGIQTEFWLYDPMDFCKDLKTWTTALLEDPACPLVHSVSYGFQGDLSELGGCGQEIVGSIDADFAKLAAKGISIIFASGDSGSGYSFLGGKLWPSWPASSPWVTAVGATRFVGDVPEGEEMASVSFGSGGGFSTMFTQKDAEWQRSVVAHYLEIVPKSLPFPPPDMFPAGGRATPDVASLGEGFQVFNQGQVIAVGGTSASAPLFAGLVSLLNEARLNAGKSQLGFLNPFIYKNMATVFTDVTKGTNAIGRGTGKIKYGFNCAEGWDPATGVGTPMFDAMLKAIMSGTEEEAILV